MLYDRGTIERYVFARSVSVWTDRWGGLTDLDVAWAVGRYVHGKPWVRYVCL